MNNFKFGARSMAKLEMPGLDPRLIATAHRALELTEIDFGAFDTIRTEAEQREMVNSGASRTMHSKHLIGKAIDIVPYLNGGYRWEWEPLLHISEAFRSAWKQLYPYDWIRWGGCWCNPLGQYQASLPMKSLMKEYTKLKLDAGKDAFPDGVHWEVR